MKTNVIRLAFTSLLFAGAASAVPIVGSINIASFNDPLFSFNTAANTVTFGAAPNSVVTFRTGSYVAVPLLATIGYNSFTYSPFLPVSPLWSTTTAGLASFNLTSITSIDEVVGLGLVGTGTAFLSGFDPTPGTWTFTASQTGSTFSFDSINSSARVPDGGATLALLGVSFLGLGGARRFFGARK